MKADFVVHLLYWVAAAAYGSTALAQSPGTFTATGKMTRVRFAHTATLLANGKVLLSGGFGALGFGRPLPNSTILPQEHLPRPAT